jgi:CheY-specific phosphatase CheX
MRLHQVDDPKDALEGNDVVVSMNMLGTVNAMFIVSVSRDIMAAIAKSVLEIDDVTPEPDEVLIDTVKEFANVVLGNVVAKASEVPGVPPISVDMSKAPASVQAVALDKTHDKVSACRVPNLHEHCLLS